MADLSIKLQKIRQKQDEERKQLSELRNVLRSAPGFEKDIPAPGVGTPGTEKTGTGYSLHQLQGDKHAGLTRSGILDGSLSVVLICTRIPYLKPYFCSVVTFSAFIQVCSFGRFSSSINASFLILMLQFLLARFLTTCLLNFYGSFRLE